MFYRINYRIDSNKYNIFRLLIQLDLTFYIWNEYLFFLKNVIVYTALRDMLNVRIVNRDLLFF